MLSHLRETSAEFPGLAQIDWAHLDNQGLHTAVSAIVRVHTALQTAGTREAAWMQQQLAALAHQAAAAAGKAGVTGLSDAQLATLPTSLCDKERLLDLTDKCSICHEDFAVGDKLRKLPDCVHTFHADCIGHWLRIKASCPMCNCKVVCVKGV